VSPANPANVVLRASGLSKRFGRTLGLDRMTFDMTEGSVYGLVGPNGAGKTTAIKTLVNIIEPTSGRAEILGADSRFLFPKHFAQIGYVSENQEMPEWMTLAYLLAYLKPFYPTWDDGRARNLVDQFNLPRDRALRQLSRGMRMKAALVASLAYRPRLLILDEPFSGLDALVRDELIESLIESAEETTILISSHDLAEIESFATHLGYLDHGRLQFSEEMRTLSARFREVEVILDAPPRLPAEWPSNWLSPDVSATVVRFVESQFDEERTVADVRRLFGEDARIAIDAMPLRAIFVALARQGRTPRAAA
jgi:ABC-2 type transport system ATP-binding protein